MSFMVSLYSKVYLEQEDSSWSARPNGRLLELLYGLNRGQGSARWIACLGPSESAIRIALGDPVPLEDVFSCALFVPQWILDSVGIEGQGDEVEIRFVRSESMQRPTRLGFKVIGNIPGDIDIIDLLEEPLSQLGVLEEGQMIPAPVLEGVCLLVVTCERDDMPMEGPVFMDGADIALEIEDDEETVAAASASASLQKPIETPAFGPFGPVPFGSVPFGSVPFGSVPFGSDDFSMLPPTAPSRGFIPFQGVGHRLG